MSDRYPSQSAEKIVVRLPDGMRDRLAVVAKANNRSVNAEVVSRLERSFDLIPLDEVVAFSTPHVLTKIEETVQILQEVLQKSGFNSKET